MLILGPPLREEGHEVAEGVLLRAEEKKLVKSRRVVQRRAES